MLNRAVLVVLKTREAYLVKRRSFGFGRFTLHERYWQSLSKHPASRVPHEL